MHNTDINSLRQSASHDLALFWAEQAQQIVWQAPWHTALVGEMPNARWFVGGKLNINDTCLEQHVRDRPTKTAIVWEAEDGRQQRLSYQALHAEVCRLAYSLQRLGVTKGDRVAIYMPLCPQACATMLACARLGATHTVIFGGFSAQSLRDRFEDSACKVVVTADGFVRKGNVVRLKDTVDEALLNQACPWVNHVLVLRHCGIPIQFDAARDVEWPASDAVAEIAPVAVEADHPLFILYTSGTTGKPKGIVHSTGGYLTQVRASCEWVFGLDDKDTYWCTADVGWITGHSYLVYGPLAMGATLFMYEGAPTSPHQGRLYELIDKHNVTILYTAPTAIRALMGQPESVLADYSLKSLRLLGSVGEPINPEAWRWYHQKIGQSRCRIVDTWWQTETGAIMMSECTGDNVQKPGFAALPVPGIMIDVVDKEGQSVGNNEAGYLVIRKPWPAMTLGVYGDSERFHRTYFAQMPGLYFSGDGARRDGDGHIQVLGRIDDVVNVSGHRLGTAEIESALTTHPAVAEAASVGKADALTGEAIVAFVTLRSGIAGDAALETELKAQVASCIGAFARPSRIRFVDQLPKTRSGKIMRRLLRELANGGELKGDMSTLENLHALDNING